MGVLKTNNKGVKTQAQGAYEIFGSLRGADKVIERYVRIKIRRSYQEVKS